MNSLYKNKSSSLLHFLFVMLSIMLITFTTSRFISGVMTAEAATSSLATQQTAMELRVDSQYHARVFYNWMKAIVDFGGFFEFYEIDLNGSRKRITSGPWKGSLKEDVPGTYILQGQESYGGSAYTIVYKQIDNNQLELDMTFRTPDSNCSLAFDIAKLAGDLFKGASIIAEPETNTDAVVVSDEPLPVANRLLLMNKNVIYLKGYVCDIEIKDLFNTNTMIAADFRLVDKSKSIYIGADRSALEPGKNYNFRYLIRFLPPSKTYNITKPFMPSNLTVKMTNSVPLPAKNSWTYYSITPKENVKVDAYYSLRADDSIYGNVSGAAENILAQEIAKLSFIRPEIKPLNTMANGRGIMIERISLDNQGKIPAEGFEIVTTQDRVIVRGTDERGCLYGVYALMGRFQRASDSWEIGCGTIRDWPDLPVRGICMELLSPVIRDVNIAKRYLDAFSRARGNTVIFLHYPQHVREWLRNRSNGGWSKEQMFEIADYARSLQMDVWGGMGSKFNQTDFSELNILSGSNLYDPLSENSYQYLFSMYNEILSAYSPSTMLISHDEIKGLLEYSALSGKSPAETLAVDVSKIRDWLANKNVRTAIWSDMLLDYNVWESKVGAAHSQDPIYNSGATHLALQSLPKDIIILDWHYGEKTDYASVNYFRGNGFRVVGSPWYNPLAAKAFAASVKTYGGQGIITTDWGFLATLSPAATTLYAPMCGWSTGCQVDQANNDVAALADTVRNNIYSGVGSLQTTVNLSSVANKSTVDTSSGNGIFGIGPFLDLRLFPSGRQTFSDVSFDIALSSSGLQNNSVVVANVDDQAFMAPLEINVYQGGTKAQSIAFLHTSFVEEPQYNVRTIGHYVVEYETGALVTVDLRENWNITDVRSSEGLRYNSWSFIRKPDELLGSKPVWRGRSFSGIPLNVQMFIWKNPYPELKIRSIRLNATGAPVNSKIALLGLTFLQ